MNIKSRLALLCMLLITVASCSYAQKGNQLGPKEFEKAISSSKNVQLVDVRTSEEFEEGHIENAENIDWNSEDFAEESSKLDKGQPVYVYCRSGKRSADAATQLRKEGYNVYELKGGLTAWEQAQLLKAPAKEKKNEKDKNDE